MSLSIHDVEKVQSLYPEHQVELRDGKIFLMNPSDAVTGAIGAQFSTLLATWVYSHDVGRVLGARTGICMPNGDLLSPKVSFVSRERLKQIPHTYLSVVPELIVEIKSSSDRVREIEDKIALFLRQGVQVGILIDPDTHTVSIYRPGEPSQHAESGKAIPQKTTLHDGETLTIPDLFPGWEVPITRLWPRVFE